MTLNPIAIATKGYYPTAEPIAIATFGYVLIGGTPPVIFVGEELRIGLGIGVSF